MADTVDVLLHGINTRDIYIVRPGIGYCRVCGNEEDLRLGACFTCADFVDGKRVGTSGIHKLWDRRDPQNVWYSALLP